MATSENQLDLVFVAPDATALAPAESFLSAEKSRIAAADVLTGRRSVRLVGINGAALAMPELIKRANAAGLDAALVSHDLKLSQFKAAFFDMDSTLVANETLDEMARMLGLGEACAEITHKAMTGEIKDYAASLRARVALLKGLSAECVSDLTADLKLNPGVETMIGRLNAAGLATYVVSSGFTILTEVVRRKLNMTGTHSNVIGIADGRFTGDVTGPEGGTIIDASGKAAFVRETMAAMRLDPTASICAGDGSNDVGMVSAAGFGAGFRPKAVLAPHCRMQINVCGFDVLLEAFADTAEVFA